ncbi:hypothetical protein [Desulfolutivibrio sulfoxidireducens]|uniref:hypothetical protein n=1 Tax=Desulfolutivibrio sulfoxidireducens TaxID=2773299 RepID=UPI00159DEEF8|nr:hypothetical protein [Desulfolutivibrio sulfoxidireducens]QLA16106.1 hypothetical protein GD605_08175 [Desulfolutivibrio sulfoxidireducens]
MNNERIPGGEAGQNVVMGIKAIAQFLNGLGGKLDVIAEGLRADDPNSEGAAGLLDDLFNAVNDQRRDAEDLTNKARELAAIAEGDAPFLPDAYYEREAIKVLRAAQDMGSSAFGLRQFICDAVVKAHAVYSERYAKPFPDQDAVTAVVEAVVEDQTPGESPS